MNELIKVIYDNDRPLVSGRELHEFLKVKTSYKDWFPRMCEYGFGEGADFCSFLSESTGGRPATDHSMTIDMAKEISMLQRNERGKEARRYFLQIEKDWNSPEKVMARALKLANIEIGKLTLQNTQKDQLIGELKPKADYVDMILKSKSLVTMTQIAKDYGMSAQNMNRQLHLMGIQFKQNGQWLLYSKYHSKGYTHSETVDIQRSSGDTEVKLHTQWTLKGRLFLYEKLKGIGILPMIER